MYSFDNNITQITSGATVVYVNLPAYYVTPLPPRIFELGTDLGVLTKRRPRWPQCETCRRCHTPRAHFFPFVERPRQSLLSFRTPHVRASKVTIRFAREPRRGRSHGSWRRRPRR